MNGFLDLLKQLIRTPSVVGAEHPFFMTIKRELEELGVGVTYYEGLLVATGNEPDSGFLSAHSDRHGLICTGPNEFQYAAFIAQNRGDLFGDSISEELLFTITDRFNDELVQAYEPWSGYYLGLGEIKNAYICQKRGNLVFEIAGLEHLMPHTPVAFLDKLKHEDGFISAQLDNVLSVAIIIHLYALGYQGTAFFSAAEEAGKSWRFMLEWFARFDMQTQQLLVLDTSPYPDKESMLAQNVVLRNKDSHAMFDAKFKEKIVSICDAKGITYHYKDAFITKLNEQNGTSKSIGRTELGRIITNSHGNINGTTLQVPTIGYHTVLETAAMQSVESVIAILQDLYIKDEDASY
ncbi:MAG: peptidase M42 [Campylobacterota bacterium]